MFEGVILYFLLFLSEEECQENCLKIKLWGSCSSLLRVGSFTSLKCRKGVWFCTRRERLVIFFFFFFLPLPCEAFGSLRLRCWLFWAHFCCPENWGCHPDKTKTPLQCKYLQENFTWSSYCHFNCISDITYAIAQPTVTSFPSFGWYSEEKHCHAFRTSRSNLTVKSVIAFERICIQDMNRGGNVCVGFAFIPNLQQVWWICLFVRLIDFWGFFCFFVFQWGVLGVQYQPRKTIQLVIAMLSLIKPLFSVFVCFC